MPSFQTNDKRTKGRALACDGVLRAKFTQQATTAGNKALEQLRLQEDASPVKNLAEVKPQSSPQYWMPALKVAAVIIFVVSGIIWSTSYPSLKISGEYNLLGDIPLGRGASISTDMAEANLVLGEYCQIKIAVASQLRLEGSEFAEAIFLERGRVECQVDRGVGEFQVKTDLGTVSVTGTEFVVDILKSAESVVGVNRLFVKVLAGSVKIKTTTGTTQLSAGEEITLPELKAPPQVTDIPPTPSIDNTPKTAKIQDNKNTKELSEKKKLKFKQYLTKMTHKIEAAVKDGRMTRAEADKKHLDMKKKLERWKKKTLEGKGFGSKEKPSDDKNAPEQIPEEIDSVF